MTLRSVHFPRLSARTIPVIAVLACIGLLLMPTPDAATATILAPTTTSTVFVSQADARVEAANPSTNFGTWKTLTADGSPLIESFLRFTVSGLAGSVESAKLRVYVTNVTADGPAVYATTNSWTERAITWATRPPRMSDALDDKGPLALNTWVEYDLSELVRDDGTYNVVFASSSADDLQFPSREGLQRPELVVTTSGLDGDITPP